MKTVHLSSTTDANNNTAIANEVCNIWNKNAGIDTDFDVIDENIIEYDLAEGYEPILWSIDQVAWNEDGTASCVDLDC